MITVMTYDGHNSENTDDYSDYRSTAGNQDS